MNESPPENLTPVVTHQEKEPVKNQGFEKIIVFGQGPVKPVVFQEELTPEQKTQWDDFKKDPLHKKEPDFRVIGEKEEGAFFQTIQDIEAKKDLRPKERQKLIELKRQEWQKMGRLSLNRWCRQNALTAGVALCSGSTSEVILSGGKTIPDWAKEKLPPERLSQWPSEAALMKDIIIRRFGDLYLKKFGKSIETAVIVEDKSTNTLENFAFTVNNNPDLLDQEKNIGLLGADFHVGRISVIANLFSVQEAPDGQIRAQNELKKRAIARKKLTYQNMLNYMTNALANSDLQQRIKGEERWESGLVDPQYLNYWLGYIGLVEDPQVLQNVVSCLNSPQWIESARLSFKTAGLDFDTIAQEDLIKFQTQEQAKYKELREKLVSLKSKQLRVMPPEK